MAKKEFVMPAMGEGIIEVTITRWFVKEGDQIQEDEPLLEVATDKVDSELPSPITGTLSKIIYHEGEIPKIGEVLALIQDEEGAGETEPVINSNFDHKQELEKDRKETKFKQRSSGKIRKKQTLSLDQNRIYLTPFVRFLAKDRGISENELLQIEGSGLNNRLTKYDLNKYILEGRIFKSQPKILSEATEVVTKHNLNQEIESIEIGPGETLLEMDRTRKIIAEHMVRSKRISPHVTSMVEIDVTQLVQWREQNKNIFFEKNKVKLTYTPLIVAASVKALKDYPGINISVKGNSIIQKEYINIGVATALPDGNLIVPVIKNADSRNILSLASELDDLAKRARNVGLKPDEIRGGTFTITNMGQYENVSGTPIINQPEVAILAVGAIKKKPGVVYIGEEPTIGVRDILVLSLTYDHRVVDGALGGSFLRAIGDYLSKSIPTI